MSKLERKIEEKFTQSLIEEKLKALEPNIQASLNDQAEVMADLQLRQPGMTLFANIEILTTIYRYPGEDEEMLGLDLVPTSVAIGPNKIEQSHYRRIWVTIGGEIVPRPEGLNILPRAPRDLTQSTFSVELQPLSKEQLRAIVEEQISEIEFTAAHQSSTVKGDVASQKRRDELAAMLQQLE